jgi:RNA polymerase sigma-70 factor (ECF subfamily)
LTDEDPRLIAGFLAGERGATAQIDGWIARAAASFRRRLGHEWEDVLQEVRIEALRLLTDGRFRGESSLKTYLWQVTAHTCLDALRRQKRRPLAELEGLEEPPPSPDPSPLDRILAGENEQALLAVLEAMSRECREVWDLILQGLAYKEISRRLRVSEGALRVRAHRCRKRAVEVAGNDGGRAAPQEMRRPG